MEVSEMENKNNRKKLVETEAGSLKSLINL